MDRRLSRIGPETSKKEKRQYRKIPALPFLIGCFMRRI